MKAKTVAIVTIALIATPAILAILARNDLGEDRFYGAIQTAGIVFVLVILGVAVGAYSLVLIRVKGEAAAKIAEAQRPQEKHVYHERHTIDRAGSNTFNVADNGLAYPDLVRAMLQQQPAQPGQALQLQAGIPAQLPAAPVRRLEDVAPVVDELAGWTPYSGMASEW